MVRQKLTASKARIEVLEKENDGLRIVTRGVPSISIDESRMHREYGEMMYKASQRIEVLERQRDTLLQREPRHTFHCNAYPLSNDPCVCGLNDVLREIAQEQEGSDG